MSTLAGLVANYGESDDESDDPRRVLAKAVPCARTTAPSAALTATTGYENGGPTAAIHPAPIPHCPWSACYDESSGFTYYWNQQTNAVTWETPPEYLLALKVAQQQLSAARSAEVSAEEWQLYQQALAEKQAQSRAPNKGASGKPAAPKENRPKPEVRDKKYAKRRRTLSDEEDVKIELITSYCHSDSESNDDFESPTKSSKAKVPVKPQAPVQPQTPKPKKAKKQATVEYGPTLPPNQNYTVPIGPELPPELKVSAKVVEKSDEVKVQPKQNLSSNEAEDSQDESMLLIKLKDKAKLLEKLGGEIPTELKKIIREEPKSDTACPARNDKVLDIDDLLSEIEKKELPKIKSQVNSNVTSASNSPRTTPPREEPKPLFPSSKAIVESEKDKHCLFPSAVNITNDEVDSSDKEPSKSEAPLPPQEKTEKKNIYLSDSNDASPTVKKKLRISNSVLPDRTRSEVPTYTTKYSTHIEGFSSEHTGLGFSHNDDIDKESPKATISYGNGLMFTKGEVLNEDKKDEELEDQMDLVEAKLKYLHQVQPCIITPVQEMLIQMQTLSAAYNAGALNPVWWRRWVKAASDALLKQEADAAPPGWSCAFQRSSGRYQYRRLADGFTQLEYPAPVADMEICTTPPHTVQEDPPLPVQPPLPPAPPPPPPPPCRLPTPPPPSWNDPPPPGTDDPPPLPPVPPKQGIGDQLASFYSEITELEQKAPPLPLNPPPPAPLPRTAPLPPPAPVPAPYIPPIETEDRREKEKEDRRDKEKEIRKKKSKVKISSSIGMKQKSVSNLVAKWQQVAEEINSD